MKSIQEDIKNQSFKQVYLLYGEEAYLRKQYKNKLKAAIVDHEDTMNFAYYEGKGINQNEIIDLAETMPFFAERRLILIENSGFFKNSNEALAQYMKTISSTTFFVFVEEEIDKRGKMFKSLKEVGRIVEFTRQDEKILTKWVLALLGKEGKKITQPVMQLLLMKTGTDMGNIEQEVEKLICYTLDHDVITKEDVELVCTTQITNHIFDMIHAIAEKRQNKALELYYQLLTLKEPPMRILFLITRQFNLLLQIKELKRLGFDQKLMGQKTGLHGFVVGKYVIQSQHFTKKQLCDAIFDCAQTDEEIKTGKINDNLGVELLIVKYSMS